MLLLLFLAIIPRPPAMVQQVDLIEMNTVVAPDSNVTLRQIIGWRISRRQGLVVDWYRVVHGDWPEPKKIGKYWVVVLPSGVRIRAGGVFWSVSGYDREVENREKFPETLRGGLVERDVEPTN